MVNAVHYVQVKIKSLPQMTHILLHIVKLSREGVEWLVILAFLALDFLVEH